MTVQVKPEPIGEVEVVLHGGRRLSVRPGFDEALLSQLAQLVESWSC